MKENNKLLYGIAALIFVIVFVAILDLKRYAIPALIAVSVLVVATAVYALLVPIYRERVRSGSLAIKGIAMIVLLLLMVGAFIYYVQSLK